MNKDAIAFLERARTFVSYHQETGKFTWNIFRGGGAPFIGAIAGSLNEHGYRKIRIDRRGYLAHRLAWLFVNGVWPTHDIDHINGKRDDNRIANLRDVDRSTNNENRRDSHASTGLLGAHFHNASGKYTSSITCKYKQIHLGSFSTPELAHQAYVTAKRKFHLGGML